jgi:hypothetical protein
MKQANHPGSIQKRRNESLCHGDGKASSTMHTIFWNHLFQTVLHGYHGEWTTGSREIADKRFIFHCFMVCSSIAASCIDWTLHHLYNYFIVFMHVQTHFAKKACQWSAISKVSCLMAVHRSGRDSNRDHGRLNDLVIVPSIWTASTRVDLCWAASALSTSDVNEDELRRLFESSQFVVDLILEICLDYHENEDWRRYLTRSPINAKE